jgi:hypothetical protein
MTIRRRLPASRWSQRYALFSFFSPPPTAFIRFSQKQYCSEVRNHLQHITQLQSRRRWFVMDLLLRKSSAKCDMHPRNVFRPNGHYFGLTEYGLSRTRTYNITVMSGAFEPIKL